MFIGHYALGYAAKKLTPKTSLGTLFIGVQLLDLLWPIFLLLGWEHVRIDRGNTPFTPLDFHDYPLSHSLLAALIWAILLGAIFLARKSGWRSALVISAAVISHWVLDWVSHRPDMPILPNGPFVGLGLWYSVPATLLVEYSMFALGVLCYFRSTSSKDRIGKWGAISLASVLALIEMANVLGPPPPDVKTLAYSGIGLWLFVAWAYWTDSHRLTAMRRQ